MAVICFHSYDGSMACVGASHIYLYVDVAENLLCKTPLPFVPHICLCAQLINVDCVLQNMHAFCMRHHFVLLHCVSRGAFTVTYPSTKRCWCSYHVENIICFQMFVVRYEIVWGFFFVLSSSHSNCTNKFVLNILRFGLRHKRNKYLFVHGRAGMLCMWRSILFSRPSFSQGVCVEWMRPFHFIQKLRIFVSSLLTNRTTFFPLCCCCCFSCYDNQKQINNVKFSEMR